jgi:hypothetical protein
MKARSNPKRSKPAVQLKDLKARKNPKGGEEGQRSRVTSLTVTFQGQTTF